MLLIYSSQAFGGPSASWGSIFSLLLSYWLGRLDLGFILWAFQTVCIHILIIIMVLLIQVIKCMIILKMYATINKINKGFDRLQKLA